VLSDAVPNESRAQKLGLGLVLTQCA
jgi:hypothetical protein